MSEPLTGIEHKKLINALAACNLDNELGQLREKAERIARAEGKSDPKTIQENFDELVEAGKQRLAENESKPLEYPPEE